MNGSFHPPFPASLDVRRFFDGRTSAWGMVLDRRGRARRRFTVDILGTVDGDCLELDEAFRFDDGASERRIWTIACGDARLAGQAGDVVGTARGAIDGAVLTWRYELMLPVGARRIRVSFDDIMVQADHETLLSRAVIRKFGLRMAEVVIAFRRLPAPCSA